MKHFFWYFERFRRFAVIAWAAFRHPQTPGYLKVMMLLGGLYLVSPIDVVPDSIPVLGFLDDAVIVPLLLGTAVQLLPPQVRADSEAQADRMERRMPYIFLAASVVVFLWVGLLIWGIYSLLFK